MKARVLYRLSAVLLLLFAIAHTLAFSQPDPSWGVGALIASIKSTRFNVMGFSRTYWDFFTAGGLSVGVFYLFAAVSALQLGRLPPECLARTRLTAWALALSFAAITLVSCAYLFLIPIIFSTAITVCLVLAAWLSSKQGALDNRARAPN
jgi:hypothetical protein